MLEATPQYELNRQAALQALNILGTERTIEFDIFPEIASQLLSTPIAAISFIDTNRQWFKASVGLDIEEMPRNVSFCAQAILRPDEILYVPDATRDPRFADNPLVSGEFGLRFYAGAPIIGPSGHAIGSMCVVDREPRTVSEDRLDQLRKLAIGVGNVLKRHASEQAFRKQEASQAMMQSILASMFQKVDAAVAIIRSQGTILLANPGFTKLLGYSADGLAHIAIRDISAPECHPAMVAAHERQLATGDPYELEVVLIRKDRSHVPVRFTSALVQRADAQPFRVLTLHASKAFSPPPPPQRSESLKAVAGCVQLLGLDPVKAAYGLRWEEVRSRLMLAAENILKRRLSDTDIYSRTNDDGFSIWFKEGTEDENAARMARIGREIRVMLLGDLGEDTPCSVGSYTQVTEVADPSAPQSVVMEALTRRLAERRREAEQQARELLEAVLRDQPREHTPVCSISGQATPSAFIDLPRALQGRFAGAMSLAGGAEADIDTELLRLGLAVQSVMEDVEQGGSAIHFIRLPITLFIRRVARERFLSQWRTFGPAVGSRLFVMLSGVSAEVNNTRVADAARIVQSMAKGVGVLLDQVEQLPFDLQSCPFSMIGLSSESASATPDAKLRAFILRMHQAKARVMVRLATGEPPHRWRSLGVDLTTVA